MIMVSGDDKACAEAKKLLPWVKTARQKVIDGRTFESEADTIQEAFYKTL